MSPAAPTNEVAAAAAAPADLVEDAPKTGVVVRAAPPCGRSPQAASGVSASKLNRPSQGTSPSRFRHGSMLLLSILCALVFAVDTNTIQSGLNLISSELALYTQGSTLIAEVLLCFGIFVVAITSTRKPSAPRIPEAIKPSAAALKGSGNSNNNNNNSHNSSNTNSVKTADFCSADKSRGKRPSNVPSATGPPLGTRSNPLLTKCNAAIDAAARQGDVAMAKELFLKLEEAGGRPEAMTYNLVLRACAKAGDSQTAHQWFQRMESRGLRPTLCTYNTLLDACAKADKVEDCEEILAKMHSQKVEANVISYATAIYARARRGDVEKAEAWLEEMTKAGVEPDAISFNSLIHAHSVRGNVDGAERWLEEMRKRKLETSVASYTAVVDACAKSGTVERAERWIESMLAENVRPNVVTFSAMIDACAKAGNVARAEYWLGRMIAEGIQPNAHSFCTLVNACAKAGDRTGAEAAERWLDCSEKAGVASDVVIYSSVIDACGKAGDAERAFRVYRRMQANGIKPHIVAFAALARPYAYRGDWIKVESIASDMDAQGVQPNEYFVYAQLLAYAVARPRQPARAEELIRRAVGQKVVINDHVAMALARSVGRSRAEELLSELCPNVHFKTPASGSGGAPAARSHLSSSTTFEGRKSRPDLPERKRR